MVPSDSYTVETKEETFAFYTISVIACQSEVTHASQESQIVRVTTMTKM